MLDLCIEVNGRSNEIDMLPEMGRDRVVIASNGGSTSLLVLKVVICRTKQTFKLFDRRIEMKPVHTCGQALAIVRNTRIRKPSFNRIDGVITVLC